MTSVVSRFWGSAALSWTHVSGAVPGWRFLGGLDLVKRFLRFRPASHRRVVARLPASSTAPVRRVGALGCWFLIGLLPAACTTPPAPLPGGHRVTNTTEQRPALFDYRGLLHLHSQFSHDSEGTLDDVLDAAALAGADFVWITDHGNRNAARWQGMHDDLLVLVGQEWSQPEGHLVVLGSPDIEDTNDTAQVLREAWTEGGLGVISHPDSTEKPWSDDRRLDAEVSGMELLNVATMIGQRSAGLVLRLPWMLFSPTSALRSLVERPDANLADWDRRLRQRPVTGVSAADRHFHWYLPFVGVERITSTHVLAPALTETDVLDALRAGRAYVAFECFGNATGFDLHVVTPEGRREMGETVALDGARLHVHVPKPARVDVFRDGERWVTRMGEGAMEFAPPGAGVYRVEVYRDDRPWILSNPVYLKTR